MLLFPFFVALLIALGNCDLIVSDRPSVFPIARNKSGCLTRFNSDREHFARCKKTICFLFQGQPPFILLDPKMKTERHQRLFPCKRPRKAFDNLKGFAFKIHQQMDLEDALCVWAGAHCSFNNMVDFVQEKARNKETREYQFASTGFVSLLPRRISLYAFPTVSFLESQVFILMRREKHPSVIHQSFHTVFNAFQPKTWLILVICVASLLCLLLVVSAVFTTPASFLDILLNVFGERGQSLVVSPLTFRDDKNEQTRDMHKLRLLHRAARLLLGLACSAFCIITILFYEISAVNFIFNQKAPHLRKEFGKLSPHELSQYAVPKHTAQESVWRRAVDPESNKFLNDSVPWYRCETSSECFDKVLDDSTSINYVVAFGASMKYELGKRQACDNLVKVKTGTPLYTFSGGWFIGRSVAQEVRVKIDQELLRLKLEPSFQDDLDKATGSPYETCAQQNHTIGPEVIAVPLLFIVGPCVFVSLLFLLCGCCMRFRIHRKKKYACSDPFVEFRGPVYPGYNPGAFGMCERVQGPMNPYDFWMYKRSYYT